MKAAVNTALVASASVLAFIGVFSLGLVQQSEIILKDLNERSVMESINQMEFAKMAVRQSAIYSTHQSVYETIKYGYYSTTGCDADSFGGIPYWRTFDSECPPIALETDLTENLQQRFDSYLMSLKLQVEKIGITIPHIKIQVRSIADNEIILQPASTEKIRLTGRNVEINDFPDLRENVKMGISDIIQFAMQKFVLVDSLLMEIDKAEDQMPKECKEITVTRCIAPPVETKKDLLNQQCPNALGKYENLIRENVAGLDSSLDSASMDTKLTITGIKSKVDTEPGDEPSTCTVTSAEDVRCGCKRSGQFGCLEYYPKYTKTCTYDYSASMNTLVNIVNKIKAYTVYDALVRTTDSRNLELNFYVASGDSSLGFPEGTPVFYSPPFEKIGWISEPSSPVDTSGLPSDCPSIWPVQSGYVNQGPGGSASHSNPILEAIDIHARTGTPVYTTHDGIVTGAGVDSYGGWYVKIAGNCNGKSFSSLYVHFVSNSLTVKVGDSVTKGTKIGALGCTGICGDPHVHYEFRGLTMKHPEIPKDVPRNCVGATSCRVEIA